jgi:lysophospholipase L1-like esterase
VKILVRGGSIAAGRGVKEGYVDILRHRAAGSGMEVLNRSRNGDTSFEGVWTFYEDIDAFRPDILLLHFGVDDIYRPVYRSEFKENMVQIVRLARRRFKPDIFLLTSHGFENSIEMEAASIYYRVLREVSADLRCGYVPVHLWWMNYLIHSGMTPGGLVQEDSRYPNAAGHALYARIITNRFQSYL